MTIDPFIRARKRPVRLLSAGLVAATVTLSAGACTHHPRGPRPTVPTTSPTPANEVTFVLKNGAIEQQGEVKAGRNTVHVTNVGTVEHEIIFIAAAGGGASLPTSANGAVDEEKLPPGAAIGEAELGAGESVTKTFTFRPGKWVAVCNVVDGANVHFAKGMWMNFTVA